MKADIKKELRVPDNVQVTVDDVIRIKGAKGSVSRKLNDPRIAITSGEGTILLKSTNATRREKKIMYTFAAHLRNLLRGVVEGHTYQLKICAAHFPMNVSVSGNQLVIKNFLGENVPRTLTIAEGVKVIVDGDKVIVESAEKEKAGMVASQIEQVTRIKDRDRRIFQDGIFIINKDGKEV